MDKDTLIRIIACVYIVYRVFAGVKKLGIFEKIKEAGLFKTKEDPKNTVKPTLTEIFMASRTSYHVHLIMYVLMLVLALLVALNVFPWVIAMILTIIFEVIIGTAKPKDKEE